MLPGVLYESQYLLPPTATKATAKELLLHTNLCAFLAACCRLLLLLPGDQLGAVPTIAQVGLRNIVVSVQPVHLAAAQQLCVLLPVASAASQFFCTWETVCV
jgi:hypothetical protein